jgi:hypothetical protein
MTSELAELRQELRQYSNPRRVKELEWFYKTEPGGYGEGDKFLGPMVPQTRSVAANHYKLQRSDLDQLFRSEYHEERLCGLVQSIVGTWLMFRQTDLESIYFVTHSASKR